MAGLEALLFKAAGGALKAVVGAATSAALAPKRGALIVQAGSTGRFRNRLIPTVEITEKDTKAFCAHVLRVIEPLMETEFRDLPENEINAAMIAVEASFEAASYDVFEFDFNPTRLAAEVLKGSSSALSKSSLSEPAIVFHSRVVHEVSAQLLNFISTWPSFLARASVEQLSRLSRIAKDLELIRKSAIDEASDLDVSFEETYARLVISKLDQLELFGVTVSDPTQRSYPLSTAYISLSVAEASRRSEVASLEGKLDLFVEGQSTSTNDGSSADQTVGGIRSEGAIAEFGRILLRGDAGSGKTTLLSWLAVNSARRSLEGKLHEYNGFVPFILPLRRFADGSLPAPHEFLSEVGRQIHGEMPTGWVNRVLGSGRAFVLIDGVDELPEGRREEARRWLGDLLSAYPKARYMVTSRPGAAEEEWLARERFTAIDLLPMSSLDIRSFVQHWHAAARSCLEPLADGADMGDLVSYENELIDAIRQQSQLRKLASNPLLCALLCTLSRDRRMQLPQGRMELYAAALDMLLVRRDMERRIEHPDAPRLTLSQKQKILGHFAYWLLRNKLSDATEDQTKGQIRLALDSMPTVEAAPGAVFSYLLVRSGVLRKPVDGRVDFIHRTFQEYLAADAVISLGDIGALVENAHLDQWHEVVTMAVGHARPQERAEILLGLLKRGNEETDHTTRLHLLAGASLENADQLDSVTFRAVRDCMSNLIPPSSLSDAKELAAVGESVLSLLPRSGRGLLAAKAASTVRTASLIGGDAALSVLSGFASDKRKAVYTELARAWTQFDLEEYADRVMVKSPFASRGLRVSNPQLLSVIPKFRNLEHLDCGWPIKDADWIGELSQLTSVGLVEHEEGTNFEFLLKLARLKDLTLTLVDDARDKLSFVSDLTQLQHLHVSGRDMDVARDIPAPDRLTFLSLMGRVVEFRDISSHLSRVRTLDVRRCLRLDLHSVGQMSNLRYVRMYANDAVLNLRSLNELTHLRTVTVTLARPDQLSEIALIDTAQRRTVRVASRNTLDLSAFVGQEGVQIIGAAPSYFPSDVELGSGVAVRLVGKPSVE
ncbi:NACHT domain-containing protein [Streptomyces sp. NPDC057705]|uniref:NACHT domain-containing protein n=1 Tax=Streptomyces sp. NPDC057705 TaxID=3346222 RepID=UPI0036B90FD4